MAITKYLGVGAMPDVAWYADLIHVVAGIEPVTWWEMDRFGNEYRKSTRERGYFPRTNGWLTFYSDGERFQDWYNEKLELGAPMGNCPTAVSKHGRLYHQIYRDGKFLVMEGDRVVREGAPTGLWIGRDDGTVQLWDEAFNGGTVHWDEDVMVRERKNGDGLDGTVGGKAFHLAGSTPVFWPRVAVNGEYVAVVWCDLTGRAPAVWLWVGTRSELTTMEVPTVNHLDTVARERAKYGTPLGYENAWKVINAVAWTHKDEGWGILAKPTGTNWNGYSIDVIINKNTGEAVDCLGNSETDGVPVWNPLATDPGLIPRWRDPIDPGDGPVTPPIPPDPDPSNLETRVARLEAAVRAFGKAV